LNEIPEKSTQATKEKVLIVARDLFAHKGYEGVSIRDIASLASVNVAAINYHFKSKENLFRQIMHLVFEETQEAIRSQWQANPKLKVSELILWVFDYFILKSDDLRAFFKMILSPMHTEATLFGNERFGPPGGEVIAQCIVCELQKEIQDEDLAWAVRTLFTSVIHLALMYSNHFCKLSDTQLNDHSIPILKRDMQRLVTVVLMEVSK